MANKKTEPLYIGTKEACERYSIGKTTLNALLHMEGCPKIGKLGNQRRIPVKEFDAFFEKVIMEGYYKPQTFEKEQEPLVMEQIMQDVAERTVPVGRQQPDYNSFGRYVMQLMQDPEIQKEYEQWLKEGAKVG